MASSYIVCAFTSEEGVRKAKVQLLMVFGSGFYFETGELCKMNEESESDEESGMFSHKRLF